MTDPSRSSTKSFADVYAQVLTLPPPLLPPGHLHSATLRASIANLSLYPCLEAALHILNVDLPSAHFLVRHMQSEPAFEAMYLHGILHRVEGDYDNARAWYGDVQDSEVFQTVWSENEGGKEGAWRLIDDVEKARKGSKEDKQGLDMEELGKRSLSEIKRVVGYCEKKFGTGAMEDARDAWVPLTGKHKEMAENMLVGGEGWREF